MTELMLGFYFFYYWVKEAVYYNLFDEAIDQEI